MPSNTFGRTRILTATYDSPIAADADVINAAAAPGATDALELDAGDLDTQPDVPRVISATAGGTAADIKAVQVTVEGTDTWGNSISEDLPAFTVDTAGTKTGVKAFNTITKVTIPAMDGAGAPVSIGVGDALGLPDCLPGRNTVIAAFLGGTKEGTAPTVTVDASDVSKNTVDLSGSYDGTKDVIVDYYTGEAF